jgi:DNA-binding MarR family transcriptional regulator
MTPQQVGASICSNGALRRATRQLGQLYDDVIGPSGLKATQFGLLYQIKTMDRPTLRGLADELVMDQSALGHTLKPLIRDRIVALVPDPLDRRVKRVALTARGAATLETATTRWADAHARFERVVGAAKAARLRETLDWIASADFADAFTGAVTGS